MSKRLLLLICYFVLFVVEKPFCQHRRSSAPYISGDTFRAYADFIFDETNQPFSPEKVTPGSTIFVKTDYLGNFFSHFHPLITSPYILISHNCDYSVPDAFAAMLDDEKLIAWFGQNVENYLHPKLHPIPIGIANTSWEHGNTHIFDEVKNNLNFLMKDIFLYMNFTIHNNYPERFPVYEQFIREPFCFHSTHKDLQSYLIDLRRSKFVLSPRGNGLDCHRTWEILYMGGFPVVKSSSLDPMYEGLPVIIVRDWADVTKDFLEKKYEEMKGKEFAWNKLDADYWYKLMDSHKRILD